MTWKSISIFIIYSITLNIYSSLSLRKIQTKSTLPKIDVLIESLCPDSVKFIKNSFKTYFSNKDYGKLANVQFYPFGNGKEWKEGDKWKFECQHGENECYGNLIQTCALRKLQKEKAFNLMVCHYENIMNNDQDFDKTTKQCLSNEEDRNIVYTCVKGDEGNVFQHEVAQRSKDHKFIPWVFVNGEYDRTKEREMQDNMVKFLCDMNKDRDNIEGCKGIDNEYTWDKFNFRKNPSFIETKGCINNYMK